MKAKTFCLAPWTHGLVHSDLTMRPCCVSTAPSTITFHRYKEWWNSPDMQQLRSDLFTGIQNHNCESCWKLEEQGKDSLRLNYNSLFKKYVDTLYDLKLKKVKGAKFCLNILWGALTEKKIYKQTTDFLEKVDLSGRDITRLQTDTHIRTHYTKHEESQFRTNYGRIKPFVLAYARSQMFFSFRKYEPLLVRCHTDSLYLTEAPSDMFPPSDKLGCLKKEFEGFVEIKSLNKIIKNKK